MLFQERFLIKMNRLLLYFGNFCAELQVLSCNELPNSGFWRFTNQLNNFVVQLVHPIVIRTLHDCPSQMNETLLISNSKLTSDSELILWR